MGETTLQTNALASAADDREPWEQLDAEPDHCYAAFLAYRDHPTRKIVSVLGTVKGIHGLEGTERGALYGWQAQYNWETRAKAWTQLIQRRQDAARLQAVEDMNRRYVESAERMRDFGDKRIQHAMQDPEDFAKVPVPAAAQMVESAQRIQRAAMGVQDTHITTGQRQGIIIQINLPGADKPTIIEGQTTEENATSE